MVFAGPDRSRAGTSMRHTVGTARRGRLIEGHLTAMVRFVHPGITPGMTPGMTPAVENANARDDTRQIRPPVDFDRGSRGTRRRPDRRRALAVPSREARFRRCIGLRDRSSPETVIASLRPSIPRRDGARAHRVIARDDHHSGPSRRSRPEGSAITPGLLPGRPFSVPLAEPRSVSIRFRGWVMR